MQEWVVEQVEQRRGQLIELCQELVRRPSPNPPGDTRQVAACVTGYLEALGLEVDRLAAHPHMPNLATRLKGGGAGRHLTFIGHMDTFPVPDARGWRYKPFGGMLVDGRVYGRGASDMKGGLAASLLALAVLAEQRDRLRGMIDFLAVSSEEDFGPYGAPFLIAQRPDVLGDAAITAEPLYEEAIGCGEKGMLWIELSARAEGGGGFEAARRNSAVERLMAGLQRLQVLREMRCDLPPELATSAGNSRTALEATTLNPGVIEGGIKINMMAQFARAEVDLRLPLGINCAEAIVRLDKLVGEVPGLTWRLIQQSEPNCSDADDLLFGCLNKAVLHVQNKVLPIGMYLPASDARLFRQRGIPAASFGPPAHGEGCPDEFVVVDDLISAAKILALAALEYCGHTVTLLPG